MIDLRKNNKVAFDAVEEHLKTSNRTCVIKPVGTGKSYIALSLLEKYPNSLYVTSYKTVLTDFMEQAAEEGIKADFRIYSNINSDEFTGLPLIIFDELHRIGAPEWSKKIDLLVNSNPDAKIVGLTATPVRHLDHGRNMADEFFFSNVAYEQTLKEAILDEELPMPEYISAIYSFQGRVNKLEKKLKGREKLKGELEKAKRLIAEADGLKELFQKNLKYKDGKYIVFCSSLEHLSQMVEESKDWFSWLPEVHRYQLFSLQGDLTEYEKFKADNSSALKLLFSIDMITEGVHPDNISGEIMLRPTASMNVFEQQLGRCLSVDHNDSPQVFDIVNNASSLREARHMIKDIAVAKVKKEGKPEEEAERYYTISKKEENIIKMLDNLEELLSDTWEYNYQECKRYFQTNGNIDIPYDYIWPGSNLRRWLNAQKNAYSQGLLTEGQVGKLEMLSIDWSLEKAIWSWEYKVEQARAYYEEHGNLIVKAEYITEDDFPLGAWIYQLRDSYKKGILYDDQIADLNECGMIWNKNEIEIPAVWLEKYNIYKSYEGFVGYDTVVDDVRIGEWASRQRSNKDNLTEEQISLLDDAGFIWDLFEYQWDAALAKIMQGEENPAWIAKQRKRHADGILSEERLKKLLDAGIDVRTKAERDRENWFLKYNEIKGANTLTDKQKSWIYNQRSKKDRLDDEQRELLKSI